MKKVEMIGIQARYDLHTRSIHDDDDPTTTTTTTTPRRRVRSNARRRCSGRRRRCRRRGRCASRRPRRIIAFALKRWNHNTLALALLHAATTQEELFRGCDWKADLAEVLVLAGWRDAREGYTVYITPEEACCLAAFMEMLLGQHDLNAPHLHDLDAMGSFRCAGRWKKMLACICALLEGFPLFCLRLLR